MFIRPADCDRRPGVPAGPGYSGLGKHSPFRHNPLKPARRDALRRRQVMHIQDIFRQHRTTFSFEFFPPKTDEASEELFANIARLQELQPSFVSVTYGAGGSTRERTHDLVVRIHRETSLTAVSHLTCVCHSCEDLGAILDRYAASGIENILALGGDPPAT